MRSTFPLVVLGLASACKREPPAPVVAPPPPSPVTEHRPAELHAEPWRLSLQRFVPPNIPDALTFHGWSSDSKRYAFEIHSPSEGADCGDRYTLLIVDASKDAFVEGGEIRVQRDNPEGGPNGCDPLDLEPLMVERRREAFARHGIVSGHWRAPHAIENNAIKWSDGTKTEVVFENLFVSDDPYAKSVDTGAAYRLVVGTKTVEDGRRRRPGVVRYGLGEALVFESPSAPYAALVIERWERAFEGARASWMSNGFAR